MELRHLRYFVAVAKELNFTRAAAKLHTSQPSLSSQIKDLEECVGVPLLMRNRRKVTITAAGELFLKEAISILEMAENAKIKARQAMLNDKSITIGFVPSAEVNVLPEVLPLLRLENPDMQIELSSVITTEQESQILDGQLDVGFMRNPVISPFVERMVVFSEPLIVMLPVSHPLVSHSEISPSMLNGQDFIATDPLYSGALSPMVKDYLNSTECQPNIVQTSTNILVTMNLVGMGLGLTICPGYMEKFNPGNVVFRPLQGEAPRFDLIMAWNKDNQNPALQELVSIVKSKFNEPRIN
ncbi:MULTISPECIES: DNA-binding transcriptional regulator HcaR [Vibrio]|uniref:Transcriptional regulator n=1 Tax=Vibrio natriegens NBRC 15636 = ATCC 14048 = DSM 759 TaxID=1219067 RepID=A0AAN0Y391_VIBNA|nr:DNA-binding transcriptional regulator HcaR [Vibrio natriegens]MEE3878051.1 DNA-binding transcriptional regulator HcaR [Vibrio sp. YYF0003]ALR15637.1 transcriptional regulator [Vibrio natriegens NBRC 15636 = ATCC 14048 = DSM 759]ANQ12505.1 transcriptional regulator [Vibrio natriegens NBRC 15636 = ATCC 14048 = DSM 759]ANQ17334.1 transcriptional regulator [Vibrio natriegens]EPM42328.1 LysR family transcriptional regulator [Vibrio natriegens NBRC 15636 = ATCC 14048 = DSM 759]